MPLALPSDAVEILESLRSLPRQASIAEVWKAFPRKRWPQLFRLLNVAADLPRLSENATLASLPADLWPELSRVVGDLRLLERLIDTPVVPEDAEAEASYTLVDLARARTQLEADHCVTIEGLFGAVRSAELDERLEPLNETRMGTWGELARDDAPGLFKVVEESLASPEFRQLTGFDPKRDEFTLTLSLQDLQQTGIGWHRDLYWPKEWVGQDVFAVLYGLGCDSPQKGGAFLHYVPWTNTLRAIYRQRHQATILWNHHTTEGRLLHAVEGYHGADTSRHLMILQCLRRSKSIHSP